jgi:DNA-binding transcriptional LysR family regulator
VDKTGGVLTVNSTETYHAACIAGLGIIQVPRVGVRDLLRAKKLIEILPQYRAADARLADLSPPAQPLPPGTSVHGVANRVNESLC